jgi:hypothetical protein
MNTAILKIAHNLAFESMFLYAQGIILKPPCYDTIAAARGRRRWRIAAPRVGEP